MPAQERMITLGDHSGIPVVPQRHARLRHMFRSGDLEKVLTAEYGQESHRLLGILVPAMAAAIPLWEWEGFASQEAMDSGEYDPETDRSPTTAEIVDAFEAVVMVAGADRLGKLMGLVQSVSNLNETPTQPSLASSGNTGE